MNWLARCCGVLVAGVLFVSSGTAFAQEEMDSESGTLTKSNPFDTQRKFSRAKVYTGMLKAGRRYEFNLTSSDFDTYLRLEDNKGQQLASDDDGGTGTNSRLVFFPKATAQYRIIVTTFKEGETGKYTLAMKSSPVPGTSQCC